MRQRQHARATLASEIPPPPKHRLLQRYVGLIAKMKTLRVGADREHEPVLMQGREKLPMPDRRAFAPRRKIGAILPLPRETEPHGYDGDTHLIVEFLRRDSHPVAQTVAGSVGERYPGRVDPDAWR